MRGDLAGLGCSGDQGCCGNDSGGFRDEFEKTEACALSQRHLHTLLLGGLCCYHKGVFEVMAQVTPGIIIVSVWIYEMTWVKEIMGVDKAT